MVGALSYQAAREPKLRGVPALSRHARRHYEGGGEVDDTAPRGGNYIPADLNVPSDNYIPADLNLLSDNTAPRGGNYIPADLNVPSGNTAPQGPLAQAAGQDPNPNTTANITALRNARSILAAGNGHRPLSAAVTPNLPLPIPPIPPDQPPPDQAPPRPGDQMQGTGPDAGPTGGNGLPTVNMPLLMAAAGMLKGGHPGGFAADLGYGMEEGAKGLEQQRQLEENARLRQAQMANTAAYQQGILNVRSQHEDNYAVTAQARAAELQAQASHLMAQAMGGMAGRVSEAQLEQQAIEEAMNGDPTRLHLLQQARSTQAAITNAETNQARVGNLNDQRLWMRQNRVTDAEMREALKLKQQSEKMDTLGKPIGTPLNLDDALAKVRSVRGGGAQPTATPSPASAPPAARPPASAPPVAGKPPAAPAAGLLPLPSSQNQLVTGQVYNTSRGPATWNGSGFTTTPTGQ